FDRNTKSHVNRPSGSWSGPQVATRDLVIDSEWIVDNPEVGQPLGFWTLYGVTGCASTAQITSGGRTHPSRLLVELGSLRASEPGNRPGRSLAIKPTYGG